MKRIPRRLIVTLSALLVIIPVSLFGIKQTTKPPTQEQVVQKEYEKAREQADVLSATVAKQTDIPQDETPNVATITDVTKLQDQEFFKQAKNGDKVLIYEKKKIIVLYRPSEKKVIATAPVLFNTDEENAASASADSPIASNSATISDLSIE